MREHSVYLEGRIYSLKAEIIEIFSSQYGVLKVEKILNGREAVISAKAFYAARNSVLDVRMGQLAALMDKYVHCKRILNRMEK